MADDDKQSEQAKKEQLHKDKQLASTDGKSGLPLSKSPTDDIDEDLLRMEQLDPTAKMSDIDDLKVEITNHVHDIIKQTNKKVDDAISLITAKIDDVGRYVQSLCPMWESTTKDVSSMTLEVSALHSKLISPKTPPVPRQLTPRTNVAPRANSTSFTDRIPTSRYDNRPSSSRDRSRSPIAYKWAYNPNSDRAGHSNPDRAPPQCSFCDSFAHLTRNCDIVMSLATRQAIMASRPNDCPKCFRSRSNSHNIKCQADVCRRGCTDDIGKPMRHMDWVCPKNPTLTE